MPILRCQYWIESWNERNSLKNGDMRREYIGIHGRCLDRISGYSLNHINVFAFPEAMYFFVLGSIGKYWEVLGSIGKMVVFFFRFFVPFQSFGWNRDRNRGDFGS